MDTTSKDWQWHAKKMPVLLWLDLETQGLDPLTCRIVEVAALLEDRSPRMPTPLLNTIVSKWYRPPFVNEDDNGWEPFAKEMHRTSGLLAEWESGEGESLRYVEDVLLNALMPHPEKSVMLAGNSIHFDRSFIRHQMPALDKKLHYRHMDVSCLKTFFEGMEMLHAVQKEKPHRALADMQQRRETFIEFVRLCSSPDGGFFR